MANKSENIESHWNNNKPELGQRKISISREIYIDRSDFMEQPEKKYFRLAPGKEVRLRHAFNITCENIIKNKDNKIVHIECTYDPKSRDIKKGNKVKGIIHWVDAKNFIDIKVNEYDRLFLDSNPSDISNFNKSPGRSIPSQKLFVPINNDLGLFVNFFIS